ncbi:MAG TPA: M14 family zinc carboxypeptidase, partial [Solirubrobacteraceae bacterium]
MFRTSLVGGLAASLILAAGAHAQVRALPAVDRSLSTAGTAATHCSVATGDARGVDAATYRAPMAGYATFRLAAPRGDWDLNVVDAASGRSLGASQGFRGREVVQGWVTAGQRLSLVGCREGRRASRGATASVELLDVAPPKIDAAGGTSLVRVFAGASQIEQLESGGFDVTHNQRAGWADVVVNGDAQRKLLDRLGLKTETRIADMDAQVRRSAALDAASLRRAGGSETPTGRESYRNYETIQAELKELVAKNPDRVRPVTIGQSYQGRDLTGVEIAENVKASDGRPVFLLVALHHAREWPSAEAAMEFAHLLASARGGRLGNVLDRTRTVIVPLINPDGYVTSRNAAPYDPADNLRDNVYGEPEPMINGAPPSTYQSVAPPGGVFSYRRKNCAGQVPDPRFPCELQWGVDPNRNYGEGWGGPGSSADPTSQSYHGPGPWSEPETQAVHSYSAKRQVTTIITLHNVAALVLRPPGVSTNGKAPDEARLKELGDRMADATGYESQYGFQLYDTSGTTEDWNYAAQGAFGYTIEIGPADGSFHMDYQTGFVDQWSGRYSGNNKGLRDALTMAAEQSADRRDHGVITGRAPKGRTLTLKKSFVTRTSEYCKIGSGYGPFNPAFFAQFGLPEEFCADGPHPPIDVEDGLETKLQVDGGRFEWDVNPSTRPFSKVTKTEIAGEGEPKTTTYEPAEESDAWLAEDPTIAVDQPDEPPENVREDRPFTVAPNTARLKLDLEWPERQEDYDLKVFRKENGAWVEQGTSGNPNGVYESVELANPAPGEWMFRVVDYQGPSNSWKATLALTPAIVKVTPPQREAWTFTCHDGKRLVMEREIFVERGERVDLGPICGATPVGGGRDRGGPPAGGPSQPAAGGSPSQGGAPQPKAEGKKAKPRKLTPRQRRAFRRCVRRSKARTT